MKETPLKNDGQETARPSFDPVDQAVRKSLRSIKPPDSLRDSIVDQCNREVNVMRFPLLKLAAMAAVFLLTIFVVFQQLYLIDTLSAESDLREASAEFIRKDRFILDHTSSEIDGVALWLAERHLPNFAMLPQSLAGKKLLGCKELEWRDQSVSLICFHLEDGAIAHLFILDSKERAPLSEFAIQGETIVRSHGLKTAEWQQDNRTYVLVGSEPSVSLKELLI